VDVAAGHTIRKGVDACDAAVRNEVAELSGLREIRAASVVSAAGGELVVAAAERVAPRELSPSAGVELGRLGAVVQAVALFRRLVIEQNVGNAPPERKRSVRGVGAARRKAGVPGCRQRCLLGRSRLVDRLVERGFVEIAV